MGGVFGVVLAIYAVAQVVVGLLKRANERNPKAPDWEKPESSEGKPVPKVYGSAYIAPQIVWWGSQRTIDAAANGRHLYFAKMIGMLCHGPVDRLYDYIFNDFSIRMAPGGMAADDSFHGPVEFGSNYSIWTGGFQGLTGLPVDREGQHIRLEMAFWSPTMFGDYRTNTDGDGGVYGITHFHWGMPSDGVCELTNEAFGEDLGQRYPRVAYVTYGYKYNASGWGQFNWASNRLKNYGWFFWGLNPYVEKTQILLGCVGPTGWIGGDMNPADILYDLLTSTAYYGCGFATNLIDKTSFDAAATTLQSERLGLSVVVSDNRAAEDYLDDILWHIDGLIYQHPTTGKLTLSLFRKDYTTSALRTITPATAREIEVSRPGPSELISEVKATYKRLDGLAASKTRIYAELVAEAPTGEYTERYQLMGRRIGGSIGGVWYDGGPEEMYWAAHVARVYHAFPPPGIDVVLQAGIDFVLNKESGVIWFLPGPNFIPGAPVYCDYNCAPDYFGYVDSTLTVQNLATSQLIGEVRSETYDIPYVTTDVVAQRIADRLLRAVSRPLARVRFSVDRTGYDLVPGAVFKMTSPDHGLDGTVLRVLSVDYGALDSEAVAVEAIEDLYADQTPSSTVSTGGGNTLLPVPVLKAPRPAGLVQVANSAIRMAIYPADATLPIVMMRADDSAGTTNVLYFQIDAGVTYYDDPVTVGLTKYYWIRHVDPTGIYAPSDWLGPVAATAVAGSPGLPGPAILPTIVQTVTETDTTGTVTLTITDPQRRVVSVRFREKEGDGLWDEWVTDTTVPYSETVTKIADQTSQIEWEVRYYDATPTLIVQGRTVSFGPGVHQAIAIAAGSSTTAPSWGVICSFRMPFDGAWTKWSLTCPYNTAPVVTLDIWSDSYGNFPPTVADSICASDKPKVAGTPKNESTALLGWEKRFSAGDVIYVNLQEARDCFGFTLTLEYNRY